jgi:hypothetical protein
MASHHPTPGPARQEIIGCKEKLSHHPSLRAG